MPDKPKPFQSRILAALVACLAIALGGLAWAGCGGSNDETSSSIEQSVQEGINEAEEGLEEGVKEAEKQLKENPKAKKKLEEAREEAEKGIEKGKAEAEKGIEEAKERLNEIEEIAPGRARLSQRPTRPPTASGPSSCGPATMLSRWPLAKVKLPLARVKIAPGDPDGTAQRALRKLRLLARYV